MSARSDSCKSTSTHSGKSLPVRITIDDHNKGRLISSTLKGTWQFVTRFAAALLLFGWCGCAAHLATVETKPAHLPAGLRVEEPLDSARKYLAMAEHVTLNKQVFPLAADYHGAQYNPQAIREVERILKLNLAVSR